MVKRRIYEAFLYTHLVFALVGLYAIWKHLPPKSTKLQWFVAACLAAFSTTTLFQVVRIIYRNFVMGRKSVRMTMSPHAEDIMHVTLSLPRAWRVSAGERICLTVPSVGLFYFFQTHPFTITWWEEGEDGNATSISLMFRARTGFTRKLQDRLKANQEYWALIDGPYGPALGGKYGISQDVGEYGHILMVTSGIGIAAQLPYAKELLQRRRAAEVRTQRISLVWRLDRVGDWESAREWLQQLVLQDNGYVSILRAGLPVHLVDTDCAYRY
jgi:predicted ferric reductase